MAAQVWPLQEEEKEDKKISERLPRLDQEN